MGPGPIFKRFGKRHSEWIAQLKCMVYFVSVNADADAQCEWALKHPTAQVCSVLTNLKLLQIVENIQKCWNPKSAEGEVGATIPFPEFSAK